MEIPICNSGTVHIRGDFYVEVSYLPMSLMPEFAVLFLNSDPYPVTSVYDWKNDT